MCEQLEKRLSLTISRIDARRERSFGQSGPRRELADFDLAIQLHTAPSVTASNAGMRGIVPRRNFRRLALNDKEHEAPASTPASRSAFRKTLPAQREGLATLSALGSARGAQKASHI